MHKSGNDLRLVIGVVVILVLSIQIFSQEKSVGVCEDYPSSNVVFVGSLTSFTPSPTSDEMRFEALEPLAGSLNDGAVIVSRWKGSSCSLSDSPLVGKRYFVIASALGRDGSFGCGSLKTEGAASAMIEYFRLVRQGSTPTEVSGKVQIIGQGTAVPGATVQLDGSAGQIQIVSDDDGRFRSAVAPGEYVVRVNPPVGYKAEHCGSPDITVVEHRCTEITLCAKPTASFTAHIKDTDGEPLGPMSNIQLTLVTADDNQFVQSVWPDEKGDLVADDLLPGKYILGLNTYLPVSRTTPHYPPTYFPGVPTRSEAEVITLAAGERKALPDMIVKKGEECEISVTVSDSKNNPSPSTRVGIAYPEYPNFYVFANEQTDGRGGQSVYAVFPGPVLLRAEKLLENGTVIQSDSLSLDSCPTKSISLKLTHLVEGSKGK